MKTFNKPRKWVTVTVQDETSIYLRLQCGEEKIGLLTSWARWYIDDKLQGHSKYEIKVKFWEVNNDGNN